MRLCSKSASFGGTPQFVSIAGVFFKKAAIMVAIPGKKTLHWQLSKVIHSGMCEVVLKQWARSWIRKWKK